MLFSHTDCWIHAYFRLSFDHSMAIDYDGYGVDVVKAQRFLYTVQSFPSSRFNFSDDEFQSCAQNAQIDIQYVTTGQFGSGGKICLFHVKFLTVHCLFPSVNGVRRNVAVKVIYIRSSTKHGKWNIAGGTGKGQVDNSRHLHSAIKNGVLLCIWGWI